MRQTCFSNDHNLYWILLLSLAACLAVQSTGCRKPSGSGPPAGPSTISASTAQPREETALSGYPKQPILDVTGDRPAETLPALDQSATAAVSWPTSEMVTATASAGSGPADAKTARTAVESTAVSLLNGLDLTDCRRQLMNQAAKLGFTVDLVQPDRTRPAVFLILAENQAAAAQLNGFFYWLADPAAGSATDQLVLTLDRLFPESGREAAIAGGLYRDSAVVSLLDASLRLMLREQYQPDVLTYILDNYQTDYRRRLEEPGIQTWSRHRAFRNMEVTYEASVYSCVLFDCRQA